MHMMMFAIVYAKDEKEALKSAEKIFEGFCNEQVIDCFEFFPENENTPEVPLVCKADSPRGKKLIKKGMDATKKYFMEDLAEIRRLLNEYTDDELFENGKTRVFAEAIGREKGDRVFLYDEDGQGIRTPRYLTDVLTKFSRAYKDDKNPYKDKEVWAVPVKVHL